MKTLNTVALALVLLAVPAFAQDASNNTVSGTWKVTGDVSGHPIDQVCTFKQEGKKLTGSCKSAEQNTTNEIAGEVDEQKVTWQYNTDYEGQKLTVAFAGTPDAAGAQLKGDIDVQPMGVGGTFTAQKQGAEKQETQKP